MINQLSQNARRLLAALLATAGLAYAALLAATYLKTTPPSSLAPDLAELHRLLFIAARPISAMERRLVASDTPLGTGPLITDGTSMAAVLSGGSNELAKRLSATELAQRDGERLALLDWIRTGASQSAYQCDTYLLTSPAAITSITPEFVLHDASTSDANAPACVRIRSIINERCVNCHHEDGDDTARLIPFDTYESIALYLRPEKHADTARPWLLAAVYSLFPFTALVAPAFAFTSYSLLLRRLLLAVNAAALGILVISWIAGSLLAVVLLTAAVIALISAAVQFLATVTELLGFQSARFRIPSCLFQPRQMKLET